ncbi:MAG: protoporphyrinogen oxidase [Bacteroidetes bacterium]|nr:protoporphyrinogen oxidase [Bacteroidota bacterium]MBU1580252.1 protoporphyrinogen oxidase [Bacteroidota bacterium]MBU2465276.1 protoporphyrinogen oxidase [Bacteroidota bacterium]MBU2557995.1 protoporphyrinogen oxidase [Bacteroidota bacterium]
MTVQTSNFQPGSVAIIGGGLTGLSLAFRLQQKGIPFLLFEKDDRLGGVINTIRKAGFQYEEGPNTGVLSTTETVELFEDIGCPTEIANPAAANRWILKKGEWVALPAGFWAGVTTPLFSFKDKLRLLGEPFRKKGRNPKETLAELVVRRMGKSFLDYAVDPFISGIYAGDPNQLITKYALPKLYQLEQGYGSFIKGAIKKSKLPKTALEKKANKAVFSAKGGLGSLIESITSKLDQEALYTGSEVRHISKTSNGFSLKIKQGDRYKFFEAERVVTSSGGSYLKNLFDFIQPQLFTDIVNLRYAKVIQIAVGFNHWKGTKLNAFGGLIPEKENRDILGVLFPASIFPGRAPEGGALMSVFMGGIKKPDLYDKTDEELKAIALKALRELFHDETLSPDLFELFRYQQAIPQYDSSSEARLAAISAIEENHPGVFLAGNIRDGIGMADRIKQAYHLAEILSK